VAQRAATIISFSEFEFEIAGLAAPSPSFRFRDLK
jgi:hypothetical protein